MPDTLLEFVRCLNGTGSFSFEIGIHLRPYKTRQRHKQGRAMEEGGSKCWRFHCVPWTNSWVIVFWNESYIDIHYVSYHFPSYMKEPLGRYQWSINLFQLHYRQVCFQARDLCYCCSTLADISLSKIFIMWQLFWSSI